MSNNRQAPSNDELEIAEAQNPLMDILYDFTAQSLTTRIGHFIYQRTDSCLAIVEKTAKWSLPQPAPSSCSSRGDEDTTSTGNGSNSKVNISPPPLVRPLPWILFLPALIALRMIRVWLSFIALLLGRQPVYPSTMVSFLQSRRRKLRALKYRGQKLQRINRANADQDHPPAASTEESNGETTWLKRIALPLRYIICRSTVRSGSSSTIHHQHHHGRREESIPPRDRAARDEQQQQKSAKKRSHKERDEGDSESSMEGATVEELLDRYADDEGDSSFGVSDTSSPDSDTSLSESDTSQTEEKPNPARNHHNGTQHEAPKESNGHAASPNKPKPKSSLNVDAKKPEEKSSKKPHQASGNGGEVDQPQPKSAEPVKQSKTTPRSEEKKSEVPAEPEKPSRRSSGTSGNESAENKTKNQKQQPAEQSPSGDNQNASKSQQPQSMSEVKTNVQQKQQQQKQNEPQQQHQQQQQNQQHHANGGGKKHKKHQHHQQNQQQQQQQPQSQQQPNHAQ